MIFDADRNANASLRVRRLGLRLRSLIPALLAWAPLALKVSSAPVLYPNRHVVDLQGGQSTLYLNARWQ
jgi:hypothetical protein